MFQIPEQFTAASKSQFDAQLSMINTLTSKAFDGVEQAIALQFSAGKAALDKSAAAAKQLLAAKDPREFFSVGASQAAPAIESAMAYGRQLYGIAAGSRAALFATAAQQGQQAAADVTTATAQPAAPALTLAPAPATAPAAPAAQSLLETAAAPVQAAIAAVAPEPVKAAVEAAPAPQAPTIAATVATEAVGKALAKAAAKLIEPAAPAAPAPQAAPAPAAATATAAPAEVAAAAPAAKAAAKPAPAKPAAAAAGEPKSRASVAVKPDPKTKK